ncbi:unnamed protein product [Closterium sp. Naga37s-1]|nr:unnamed protein product [Closterium sp. Naga37s-1]
MSATNLLCFRPTLKASDVACSAATSEAADFQLPAAACNGDGEMRCSSVLLKSVRPLLETLAKHMHASSQGLADGQHKPMKVHVAVSPDVKRPGIGRFGGKPAAVVLAPVVVTAAPLSPSATAEVTPSAVVAPVVVPEVAPVATVASTTLQVPEACVTTEALPKEASARVADSSEKARWVKLCQEVRAMDCEWARKLRARAAYLRWANLNQETWSRDIEAAIEACLPAWIVRGKPVSPASPTTASVAEYAALAVSSAAAAVVKSPAAASQEMGISATGKV